MRLAVISHKKSWAEPNALTGFATQGGFPQQISALAELFDETTLYIPRYPQPAPAGVTPLSGRHLTVRPLDPLPPAGIGRKIAMIRWLPCNLGRLWRGVRAADAVHIPIPGDIGTVGLLLSLAQGKPLFVRHCSLWGKADTLTERWLFWLLERVAGGRNVVLATGLGSAPPSAANPAVRWIFSSSLSEAAWASLPQATPWQPGQPLRLVTVGRIEPVKNTAAILHALAQLRQGGCLATVDIVGDGGSLPDLKQLAQALGLAEFVTFHGNVPHAEVLAILARGHLFLLPSFVEGFPKAALEAMACGLPVIATAVSALPVLIGRDNGLLLETPSAEALAAAIRQATADPSRLTAIAASARTTSGRYTLEGWRDTIGQYLMASWQRPLRSIGMDGNSRKI